MLPDTFDAVSERWSWLENESRLSGLIAVLALPPTYHERATRLARKVEVEVEPGEWRVVSRIALLVVSDEVRLSSGNNGSSQSWTFPRASVPRWRLDHDRVKVQP
jgi:hypothetical protein